jgi:membrane protease YdiL (CAAX protease family)
MPSRAAAIDPPVPKDAGWRARMEAEPRWRWSRWTRLPFSGWVWALAAVTVFVDVVTAWAGISIGYLGRVPISPALPLGFALAAAVGLGRLGLDRTNRRAWREVLVVGGAVLFYAVCSYGVKTSWNEAFGLVLAALGEELVYRLAVIIVVGALVAWLMGRDWRNAGEWGLAPGLIALLTGSVVFSALPGHVAQMSNALHALPFASLGLVLGYAVLRTGALFPAAVVHALMNLATISALEGNIPPVYRGLFCGAALVALLTGTIVAGLRLGILRRVPAVVDLTALTPREPAA